MIDQASGWIGIRTVTSALADQVSNIVELAWLTRYQLPSKVIIDRENEFWAELKTMIQANYGIAVKPITSRNPQANSILARTHQTIGYIIRQFKVQDMELDDDNPWDKILVFTMFALRASHTTTQYTSTQ